MEAFLGPISHFFSSSISWVSQIMNYVAGSAPLTVLVLGFPIVGFAFGLLKRLISM